MAIKLGNNVFIKRGSRPTPLSKYETKDLNDINAIPYPIQSDIEKNNNYLCQYKKMFKTNLGYNFSLAIRGDLLMTSSCDIGNVVILNLEKAFIDDKFFNLKTSPLLEKQYLKYWIIKNKKEISELGYGTTFNVLYIEPFSKYLNTKFVPDLQIQQEIINIIEPKEQLFLKYHNVVDISDLDKFKKTWSNLINIIEPFEKLKNTIIFKIKKIESIMNHQINNTKENNFSLGEFDNFQGFAFKSNDFLEKGKYIVYKIANILNINQNISYTNNPNNKVFLKEGDVVTGLSGSIGTSDVILENNKYLLNQRLISIRSNYSLLVKMIIEKNKKILESYSTGSVQMNITKNDVLNLKYDKSLNNYLNLKISKLYILYNKKNILINKIIACLIELHVV